MGNILDTFNYFDHLQKDIVVGNSNRNEYFINEEQVRSLYIHKVNLQKAFKYAKDMENGDNFPPVQIYFDQKLNRWRCKDGAHRTTAARMTGKSLFVRSKAIMGENQ